MLKVREEIKKKLLEGRASEINPKHDALKKQVFDRLDKATQDFVNFDLNRKLSNQFHQIFSFWK